MKRALANKMGARFALIVGEDELASGTYQLNNMATGEQQTLKRDELIGAILLR